MDGRCDEGPFGSREPGAEVADTRNEDAVSVNVTLPPSVARDGDGSSSQSPHTTKVDSAGDNDQPSSSSLRHLGRFHQVRLLGRGGIGEVYEAYDSRLQRRVAVKVLTDRRPEAVQRFLREARAQARVQHESICPIFEVGESDGVPHIVMQLVSGKTLDEAAPTMTLEQKLLVIARAATAVHEAHRAGLVHRDLKPGNLMVEETGSGDLRVFVLDFGIARPVGEGDLTTDGSFIGTPAYSSPEQVRGESSAIDRRADVYGLGATLYCLVAGEPPFSGTVSAVMTEVLSTEPKRLRPLGVPVDVETIVMKCLDKDPERRYQSARALAEDLHRFLDGDPIQARAIGLGARVLKQLRKHRVATAAATAALVLVTAALAWGGFTQWRAATRERMVRDLSAQVEGIEAEIRYSYMSPRHDIGPDQARLRHRMALVRARIEDLGPIAEGPGWYALGRAYLALGELEEARQYLELAWASGARNARVAHALGLTLSLLYRQQLALAQAVQDQDLRAQLREQLRHELQRPAVEYMVRSLGDDEEEDRYLRALMAFHQDHLDQALGWVEGIQTPWFHEAHLLRGDILRERAQQHQAAGRTHEAEQDLVQALAAYSTAQHIAESDPRSYLAAGQTEYLRMLAVELTSQDARPLFEAGIKQADLAAMVLPSNPRVLQLRARLHFRQAESLRLRHRDPEVELERALESARRAVDLAGPDSEAWLLVGLIRASRAEWLADADRESLPLALDEALDALDNVPESSMRYRYFNALGAVRMNRADLRATSGQPAEEEYELAGTAFRSAIAQHPEPHPYEASVNLHQCLMKLAALPGVENRVERLREAATALEQVLQQFPERKVAICYNLGRCYLRLAQAGDPLSDLLEPGSIERGLHYLLIGQTENPELPHFYSVIGEIRYLQGRQAWDAGRDPERFFSLADKEYRAGLELSPSFFVLNLNLAWLSYFRGKYRVREGRPSDGYLRTALLQAQRANEHQGHPGATLCIGSAYCMLAEEDLDSGRDPGRNLEQARRSFRKLVNANPQNVMARRGLALAWTLEARSLARTGQDPTAAFSAAEREIEAALKLNPAAPSVQLAAARWCFRLASWRQKQHGPDDEVDELISTGIEHAEHAIELRPGLAEAATIRAALLAIRRPADGSECTDAIANLCEALRSNPHLEHEWGLLVAEEAPSDKRRAGVSG